MVKPIYRLRKEVGKDSGLVCIFIHKSDENKNHIILTDHIDPVAPHAKYSTAPQARVSSFTFVYNGDEEQAFENIQKQPKHLTPAIERRTDKKDRIGILVERDYRQPNAFNIELYVFRFGDDCSIKASDED
ncbi:MAG: hypothetical protein ABIG30_01850 [Candidatus Aenigmatarchaeota archaeon]